MLRVALDTNAIRARTEPLIEQARQEFAQTGKPVEPPPLDEQFLPEVVKKLGASLEIEITVYNWTAQELKGSVAPVLPAGWLASPAAFDYTVAPMKFARFTATATVPPAAGPGVYAIGAQTHYRNVEQRELHPHRVNVVP